MFVTSKLIDVTGRLKNHVNELNQKEMNLTEL